MSECVKVVVRCRPLNQRETDMGCKNVIYMDKKKNQVQIKRQNPTNSQEDQPKVFTFDAVFFVDSKQEELYEQSAFPLVEQVFEGYNGTMFAYGQTGCGKSFSMMGIPGDPVMKGVIPRTFDHIVNVIDNDESGKTYLVRVSYIEIYMEEIRDLLAADHTQKLDLKEDPQKGVYCKGLNQIIVKSVKEMDDLMNRGNENRVVGATKMNATSSRSHSIFTINVEVQEKIGEDESFKAGKLNLVDLAGSEKQSKTQAEGARLKEATKINLSLSALGNVISALSSGKGGHIPYRDSKLTRLLQDSLGGNTKTIMMAALSPADDNYEETVSTLRYAARTKNIKNKPVVNMDPKDALLKEYQDEINRLKEMLANGGQLPPDQMPKPKLMQKMSMNADEQIKFNDDGQLQDAQDKLDKKNQELLDEKQQREKLEQMLKDMEKNKLQGGHHQLQTDEEAEKYKKMKQRLKKQKLQQEKMREEQERKEIELLNVEKKYNSLNEEVENLRIVQKELKKKYEYQSQEIRDLEREHEIEKQELLDTIRQQEKDHKLNNAIIEMLLTTKEYEIIKNAAVFKESTDKYVIPPFTFKDKKLKFPKLPQQQAQDLVDKEKYGRELDFGDSNHFQDKTKRETKNMQQYTNGFSDVEYNSAMNEGYDNGFYNANERGRTTGNPGQTQNNIRISKLQNTRQKFYSANPHSNGQIETPNQKQKNKISMDKKKIPNKLTPLDPVTSQKMQNQVHTIHEQHDHFNSVSPEKSRNKIKNGIQLNPLNHNAQMQNNSQISDSIMNGELKKHKGLAPLNHNKRY